MESARKYYVRVRAVLTHGGAAAKVTMVAASELEAAITSTSAAAGEPEAARTSASAAAATLQVDTGFSGWTWFISGLLDTDEWQGRFVSAETDQDGEKFKQSTGMTPGRYREQFTKS